MPEDRQGTARAEIERYLQRQDDKGLLRLITCGSVDDGKSTLLGRLLYDSQLLFEDQLSSLAQDSQRFGTTGSGELDLALLVDGLAAEREQGITIDVAYRFFATEKRKFIVADVKSLAEQGGNTGRVDHRMRSRWQQADHIGTEVVSGHHRQKTERIAPAVAEELPHEAVHAKFGEEVALIPSGIAQRVIIPDQKMGVG